MADVRCAASALQTYSGNSVAFVSSCSQSQHPLALYLLRGEKSSQRAPPIYFTFWYCKLKLVAEFLRLRWQALEVGEGGSSVPTLSASLPTHSWACNYIMSEDVIATKGHNNNNTPKLTTNHTHHPTTSVRPWHLAPGATRGRRHDDDTTTTATAVLCPCICLTLVVFLRDP